MTQAKQFTERSLQRDYNCITFHRCKYFHLVSLFLKNHVMFSADRLQNPFLILFFFVKIICAGPILKSKGVGVIFQKKSTEMLKKGQNIWEFGQKCTKFEYILKKGRRLRPTIEHNKLLE